MQRDAVKRLSRKKTRAPAETRRITVGFRVSESVRKCLEDAASKNARSLSAEAEHRLEASFGDEADSQAGTSPGVRDGRGGRDVYHRRQHPQLSHRQRAAGHE